MIQNPTLQHNLAGSTGRCSLHMLRMIHFKKHSIISVFSCIYQTPFPRSPRPLWIFKDLVSSPQEHISLFLERNLPSEIAMSHRSRCSTNTLSKPRVSSSCSRVTKKKKFFSLDNGHKYTQEHVSAIKLQKCGRTRVTWEMEQERHFSQQTF